MLNFFLMSLSLKGNSSEGVGVIIKIVADLSRGGRNLCDIY